MNGFKKSDDWKRIKRSEHIFFSRFSESNKLKWNKNKAQQKCIFWIILNGEKIFFPFFTQTYVWYFCSLRDFFISDFSRDFFSFRFCYKKLVHLMCFPWLRSLWSSRAKNVLKSARVTSESFNRIPHIFIFRGWLNIRSKLEGRKSNAKWEFIRANEAENQIFIFKFHFHSN